MIHTILIERAALVESSCKATTPTPRFRRRPEPCPRRRHHAGVHKAAVTSRSRSRPGSLGLPHLGAVVPPSELLRYSPGRKGRVRPTCHADHMTDLEQVRARATAASEGPWQRHGSDVWAEGAATAVFTGRDGSADVRQQADSDADFVAHARQDINYLLALLDQQKEHAGPRMAAPSPGWPIRCFSLANPASALEDSVPALLRRLASELDRRGLQQIQDLVLHTEFGASPSITVYFAETDTDAADNRDS